MIGVSLSLTGVLGLAVALAGMAGRLRQHNRDADFPRWKFADAAVNPEILYAGEKITISDGTASEGAAEVRVTYRGETLGIPIGGRNQDKLPGLLRYSDWLQIFEMQETRGRGLAGHDADARSRLVLVARQKAPGENDDKFVNRRAWVYDVVEFRLPGDASPAPEALPEPAKDARAERAGAAPLARFVATDAFARWTVNFSALPNYERTWQYAAALAVTPRLSYPRNKFTDDGMTAMTWTWPAAGVSGLALVVGLIVTAGSFVRPPARSPSPGGVGRTGRADSPAGA